MVILKIYLMNTFKYIEKMIACEISNNKLDDYFLGFRKMVNIEKRLLPSIKICLLLI